MAKAHSITSIPLSPADERRSRMVKYSISMAIRMVCIVAMLFVSGWWLLLCAAGAIFLPYFAVVLANQTVSHRGQAHATPVSNAVVPVIRVSSDAWAHETGPRGSSEHE